MSKIETIEGELQKLSPQEMREVRDWLNDCLVVQPEFEESQLMTLREDVTAGINEVKAGNISPFDDAAVARIKARGQELLAAKRSSNP